MSISIERSASFKAKFYAESTRTVIASEAKQSRRPERSPVKIASSREALLATTARQFRRHLF